jgi:hypothetical protein
MTNTEPPSRKGPWAKPEVIIGVISVVVAIIFGVAQCGGASSRQGGSPQATPATPASTETNPIAAQQSSRTKTSLTKLHRSTGESFTTVLYSTTPPITFCSSVLTLLHCGTNLMIHPSTTVSTSRRRKPFPKTNTNAYRIGPIKGFVTYGSRAPCSFAARVRLPERQ